MFDFEYRVEIFVPPAKRRWGCFVLPFLLGERLVARVDLKAGRADRRLIVAAAYREPHAVPGPLAEALAFELKTMAGWLELDSVIVERATRLLMRLGNEAKVPEAGGATRAAPGGIRPVKRRAS